MIIESGIGNGKLAAVDEDNRLITASFNIPFPHLIAKDYQKVFTVEGNTAPTSGDVNVLQLKNNTSSDVMVITRIIVQAVTVSGGTALPNSSNYFQILNGASYASGGLAAPIVNTTSGSAVSSGAVAYDSNPTLSGTGSSIGRFYPVNAAPFELLTEGSITVLPQQEITIGYTGDHTGGFLYANVGFCMVSGSGYSG